MKILQLSIIAIVIASIAVISVMSLQISTLQDKTRILNETNQKLVANLTNYQDLFGNISKNYTFASFALKTHVYVAQAIGTQPVTEVKLNEPYQVIANITKIENVQPVIYYYCLVQVTDPKGLLVNNGWGQGILIPKQPFSQCAISWTPATLGNYTISAFAWRSLFGTPWAEASTSHVQVVP
ncbi:MAG TPA: hypothetical protein VFW99_03035 [Candidatus Nitrosotalea sp.]|nr:hypothetical protein [Candidatus Nitrosotalea sp.]